MDASGVAYFGGSFDPVHVAHVAVARQAYEVLGLGHLYFLPVGNPSHRQSFMATPRQRLAMLYLAIDEERDFSVDDREIRRQGPTYTIDTLREIRQGLGWQTALWFLIGGDAWCQLHTWKNWMSLFEYAFFVVAPRSGQNLEDAHPEVLKHARGRVRWLPPLGLPISSTQIRSNPLKVPEHWLHPKVRHYLLTESIYSSRTCE